MSSHLTRFFLQRVLVVRISARPRRLFSVEGEEETMKSMIMKNSKKMMVMMLNQIEIETWEFARLFNPWVSRGVPINCTDCSSSFTWFTRPVNRFTRFETARLVTCDWVPIGGPPAAAWTLDEGGPPPSSGCRSFELRLVDWSHISMKQCVSF